MHHKAFGSWAPREPAGEHTVLPDPQAGFREWGPSPPGGKEGRGEEGTPPLLLYI